MKKIQDKKKILKNKLEELWKMYCLLRDNNTCQYCGSKEDLQVHHIISRKNSNTKYDVDNGITLCKRCHAKISLNNNERMLFMLWYFKKFGIEKYEQLQEKARQIKNWRISELEEAIKDLQNKIKNLGGAQ